MYSIEGRIIVRDKITQEEIISISNNKDQNSLIVTQKNSDIKIIFEKETNIIRIYEKNENNNIEPELTNNNSINIEHAQLIIRGIIYLQYTDPLCNARRSNFAHIMGKIKYDKNEKCHKINIFLAKKSRIFYHLEEKDIFDKNLELKKIKDPCPELRELFNTTRICIFTKKEITNINTNRFFRANIEGNYLEITNIYKTKEKKHDFHEKTIFDHQNIIRIKKDSIQEFLENVSKIKDNILQNTIKHYQEKISSHDLIEIIEHYDHNELEKTLKTTLETSHKLEFFLKNHTC